MTKLATNFSADFATDFAQSPSSTPRALGLAAASANNWTEALLHLNSAARQGHYDLMVLDALGEAAYRTNVPEVLGPYQNHYKYPTVATHMARAFLMLGDVSSCREFLSYAKDSALKSALAAMLELGTDISKTASEVLPVAEKHPDLYYPEYWRALSAVADAVGRDDLTHLSERRSKAFAYKDANIHFNQALRMLAKGEFRAGWRLYDWRLVPSASQSNRTELGRISMWEGESLKNKTLLIYLEQGLGDGIFALRYIQTFLDQGVSLEIVARPTIIPLIQTTYPNIKIHNEDEVVVVGYWEKMTAAPDFWVYGLSIPFRANLWRPMNTAKFVAASAALVSKCAQRIRNQNSLNLPVYTLNWHGRIDTESDRSRAFSIEEFAQVTGIEQKPCVLISLQKDATREEINFLQELCAKNAGQFFNAAPELDDFGMTSAWIAASHRLLTCDTSVAHLGGALGHPTTVFVRNKAIWQWLRKDHETAVWYDSVFIQYALAPQISWLFTTINNQPNGRANNQVNNQINKSGELNDDKSDIHSEKSQLSSSEIRPTRLRGQFRFAGRPE